MPADAFTDAEFAAGFCPTCERDVLTHSAFDAAAFEIRLCVHCDGPVDVEMVRGTELTMQGYQVVEPRGCGGGKCGRG